MSRFLGRRLTIALLGAVLAVGLVTPAQADPRSTDPELVQRADAHEHADLSSTGRAGATIDSDVYAYALSPTFRSYFVVAGRLKLQLASGSTTKYKGAFIDYVGNKSYDASADATDPSAPKIKLKSTNGTFEFVSNSLFGTSFYSGIGKKVPSRLKVPASQVSFGASTHVTRSRTYAIALTERSGAINNPIEYAGTLVLLYDANSRISGGSVTVSNSKGKNVTHSLTSSGYSGATYFYTVAKVDKTSFGIAGTISGTVVNGFAFGANGSKTAQWILSGTAA